MEIKDHSKILSKDLKWLAPYLEAVADIVPLNQIKKIGYYKNRTHQKNANHLAITHRLLNNKTFYIYIRTDLPKENRIPLNYDDQEDVLWYLSHELAHVCPGGWEHSKHHFKTMSVIFSRFGKVLFKLGFEKDRNK